MKPSLSRLLPLVIGAVLLVGAVALSRSADDTAVAPAETADRAPGVRVATVAAATEAAADRARFSGTVRSARRARLSFEVGGRLAERAVDIGDRVRSGQVLARLDAVELTNASAAAEAAAAEVRARLDQQIRERDRVEELFAANAATREEREQAGASVATLTAARDRADAQLAETRRRRSRAVLTAPYDGVVTDVPAEPGEYLPVGRTVLEISGDGRLEVEVGVPESMLAAVESLGEGARVEVALPFAGSSPDGRTVFGRLRSVGRSTAGPGRLYPVVVDLGIADGARVASGMAAEVLLPSFGAADSASGQDGSLLTLPLDAVINPGGREPAVFVVREADGPPTVERLAVEIRGWRDRHVLATAAGLAAGDRVVVAGQSALTPGGAVAVAPIEMDGPKEIGEVGATGGRS